MFGYICAMSPYTWSKGRDRGYKKLFYGHLFQKIDTMFANNPPLGMYLYAGKYDIMRPHTARIHRRMMKKGYAHEYRKYPGGHGWKKGWIDEFDWLTPMTKRWTKDECKKLAMSCNYKYEFRTKYFNAYRTSVKRGWIQDYSWLKDKYKLSRTKAECKEIAEKYTTLKDFRLNDYATYFYSYKKGWLYDFAWLKSAGKNRKAKPKKKEPVYFYSTVC
jgi:hypothetical protein